MKIIRLGLMEYHACLALMEEHHMRIAAEPLLNENELLIVQHPAVVTMGKRNLVQDMLMTPDQLKQNGIDFAKIDRGGSVTVHEPGQLVIYPLIKVQDDTANSLSVRQLVWIIEESMIVTCKYFGVCAQRDAKHPGVWVQNNKIGALGLRIHNGVSKHGMALNVVNSLQTFQFVVPCGIHGRGVTSLQAEIKKINPITTDILAKAEDIILQTLSNLLYGSAR